jgi:hypothetical protein
MHRNSFESHSTGRLGDGYRHSEQTLTDDAEFRGHHTDHTDLRGRSEGGLQKPWGALPGWSPLVSHTTSPSGGAGGTTTEITRVSPEFWPDKARRNGKWTNGPVDIPDSLRYAQTPDLESQAKKGLVIYRRKFISGRSIP